MPGNPNSSLSSELQSLLYYKFTYKKQYDKNEAAVFINKAPDTMQRYCSGRLAIPVDIARDLIKFILSKNPKDTELLEFFCPSGFIVIKSADYKIQKKDIKQEEIELSILNGKALEAIEDAYEDGKIEKNEWKRIHRLLIQVRQYAAEIDEKIKKEIR